MNLEEVTMCPSCNKRLRYADSEKTVIQIVKDGQDINQHIRSKALNISFECPNCSELAGQKTFITKTYPYNDEKFIPLFIEDIKKYINNSNKRPPLHMDLTK